MKGMIFGTAGAIALVATGAAAATKSYILNGFDKVSTSAGTDVDVAVGPAFLVTAEGDQTEIDRLVVKVEDGTLFIGRKMNFSMFGRSHPLSVKVALPALSGLFASSGSDVRAAGVDAPDFRLKASSGANAEASGRCAVLSAEASSGADIEASDLQCETVTARASSGADVDVFASKSVVANASSGGDVTVIGKPQKVSVDKSSGGDVSVD